MEVRHAGDPETELWSREDQQLQEGDRVAAAGNGRDDEAVLAEETAPPKMGEEPIGKRLALQGIAAPERIDR
jgi:hypothetical protein